MKRIRWDKRHGNFVLGDGTSSAGDHSFTLEQAQDVSLTSLRTALASQAGVSVLPISDLPTPKAYGSWEEYLNSTPRWPDCEIFFTTSEPWDVVFFHLTYQGHLTAGFKVDNPVVTDQDIVIRVTRRVFRKLGVFIQYLDYRTEQHDEYPGWYFQVACNPTGQTVGSLWNTYRNLCFALTTFPEDLTESSEGVQLALRLGRPDILIGAPESSWLEVKSKDYFLSSATEKIKLAQDVARFANANGGLLVLGLKTSRPYGVDIITRVTPLPLPRRSVAQYRSIIDAHLYPFVRGLEVYVVPFANGEIVIISIPSQLESDRPFLVHGNLGNITDNKVKGQFVSIVQRRGDGAEYLSGPAIHGLLVGRKRSVGAD